MAAKIPLSLAERSCRYRARKRAAGLRLVQIWVYDTTRPAFRRELRRQALRIAASEREAESGDFVEAVADWPDR